MTNNRLRVPNIPEVTIYPSLIGQPMDLQWVRWFEEFQRIFGDPLAGLIGSRLVATDSSGLLASVTDLTQWIAGTALEIIVSDDGDGTITLSLSTPLTVPKGGTGLDTITDHAIMLGSGVGAVTPLGPGSNGQIPIGSTGDDPVMANLTDSNLINTDNGAGSITFNDDELEFYIQAVS